MHDAISAEKAGTPAAAILTDAFLDTASALARACGMPDYSFAVIKHPVAPDDDDALRQKAAQAVRQCVALLTRR